MIAAGAVSTTLLISGSAALANDNSWQFVGSFYLFGADTHTSIGGVESELSFGDAVKNLDLAFMGALEARRGNWSIIADYMLTDLSFDGETPGPIFSASQTKLRTQFFSGYLAYTVYDGSDLAIDVAGGFRWFETDTSINFLGGPTLALSAKTSDTWIDPLVAFRLRYEITDRWSAIVSADYGGFNSDSETFQFVASAGYAINQRLSVRGGYRFLQVDHEIDGVDFKLSQSGPVLGLTYRF